MPRPDLIRALSIVLAWPVAVALPVTLSEIRPVAAAQAPAQPPKPVTTADVIAASKPSDWRATDPANTIYVELPAGRVIIELAPAFAPLHIANIRALVAQRYFDAADVIRVQDNYVAQWARPDDAPPGTTAAGSIGAKAAGVGEAKPALRAAEPTAQARAAATRPIEPEFDRKLDPALAFDKLPDGDVYAPAVGFSNGFPAARDRKLGLAWLAHCYGMVGVGRDNEPKSGSGAELYVVIGQAPRHLDRNVALIGRVLKGIELLSSLPRGTAAMGFYAKPGQRVPIKSIRFESEIPPAQRTPVEVMRTDTPEFNAVIESRRNRRDGWTQVPAGKVELCNVPLPVRDAHTSEHDTHSIR